MTIGTDQIDLGWHGEWVSTAAQNRAATAFLESQGHAVMPQDERGFLLWERRGLDLANEVSWWMTGLEEPTFIAQARQVAVEIYLRRLHQLLCTLPVGGHC